MPHDYRAYPPGKPDYTALDLPPAPADRPYVLLNMVASLDGKVAVEGRERGLGSPTDQRLMRELRVNADVILNGAGTLRASGTSSRIDAEELQAIRRERGKTPAPTAAVISRSGDLTLDRRFFTAHDEFDAVLYLASSAPADRRAAIVATGRPVIDVPPDDALPNALHHMRHELRAEVLLVEGGPTLNGALLQANALDELFLTLGPLIVGGSRGLTAVETSVTPTVDGLTRMKLIHAIPNPETGEVYLRYRHRP